MAWKSNRQMGTHFELEVGIWYGRAYTISKRRLAVLRAYQSWQYDKLTWAGCQILNPMNPAHVHKFDKLFRTGCHGFSMTTKCGGEQFQAFRQLQAVAPVEVKLLQQVK